MPNEQRNITRRAMTARLVFLPLAGFTLPLCGLLRPALAQIEHDIIYEEPHHQARPELLRKADDAIFQTLSAAHIHPNDISLSFAFKDGVQITTLTVKPPPDADLGNLIRELAKHLDPTHTSLKTERHNTGAKVFVSVEGKPSHCLTFNGGGTKPVKSDREKPEGKPKLAIVIDDMGYGLRPAKRLLGMGMRFNYSILPFSPNGVEVARLASKKGMEVLLHLPMQPKSSLDPGPGKLLLSMSRNELLDQLRKDLKAVPNISGVNNHMGSAFTADAGAMQIVLDTLADHGLYFLDSLTTGKSKGHVLAKEMGLPYAVRDVFLDHDTSQAAVEHQLRRLLRLSRHNPRLIAIGHPHRSTLNALEKYKTKLRQNLELVSVSQLLGNR